MGWDNPPVPWRELERRLSWRSSGAGSTAGGDDPKLDRDGVPEEPRVRLASRSRSPRSPRSSSSPRSPRSVIGLPDSHDSQNSQNSHDSHGSPAWAELHCHSSYSFLDGASSPSELVAEAAERGLTGLAITDHDGMYGVPQFAQAAARLRQETGVRVGTVFGAELSLDLPGGHSPGGHSSSSGHSPPGTPRAGTPRVGSPDPAARHLLVLARDPEGYKRLCQVISAAQLAGGQKGRPVYDLQHLAQAHDGHWVILTGCRKGAVPAALRLPRGS